MIVINFNGNLLANDEWLQMMQQKHHIDMILFGERIPLESENKMEENLFAVTQVSKEAEETKTETETTIEAETKKKA